jgi:hypothetical protein
MMRRALLAAVAAVLAGGFVAAAPASPRWRPMSVPGRLGLQWAAAIQRAVTEHLVARPDADASDLPGRRRHAALPVLRSSAMSDERRGGGGGLGAVRSRRAEWRGPREYAVVAAGSREQFPGESLDGRTLTDLAPLLRLGDGSHALFGIRRSLRMAGGVLRGFQRLALMLGGSGCRFPCSTRRANSQGRRDAGNNHPGQIYPISSVHKAAL